MSKYCKQMRAGRYVFAVAYSRPTQKDSPAARAEKKKHSTKARQLLNEKASRLQLTGIIAENFADSETAFFCSLTFDDAHYPEYAKQSEYWAYCIRQGKNWLDRLKYVVSRRGGSIRYVFCAGIGEGGRWHIHALVDGCTAEDLTATWTLGNIDFHNLYSERRWGQDRQWRSRKGGNVNPVAIAKYMMRNASCRPLGKHPWHASRNCKRPTVERAKVIRDASSIEPPMGSEVLSMEKNDTMYSQYVMYEYILPQVNSSHRRKLPVPRL